MTAPAARLMIGRTVHRREQPFTRRFSYRIAMIDVDVDRLPEAARAAVGFSINGRAPINLRTKDYGARQPGSDLAVWARETFADAGIDADGCAIRLLAFPRVLGFGFSPISVWRAMDPYGGVRAAIYEVHNTFGETHAYVCALLDVVQSSAQKEFFVSPFFGVDGEYRFTLRENADCGRFELIVESIAADGRSHIASLVTRPKAINLASIAGMLVGMPMSGLGVVVAIHWQALILLLKGARYRNKPQQRPVRTTLAAPMSEQQSEQRTRISA